MIKNYLEGIAKGIKTLEPYLTEKEQFQALGLLAKNDLTTSDIEKYFTPNRAKDIAEIFFKDRKELKKYQNIIKVFSKCSQYYDQNISLNLIMGKGALVAEGMFGPIDRD